MSLFNSKIFNSRVFNTGSIVVDITATPGIMYEKMLSEWRKRQLEIEQQELARLQNNIPNRVRDEAQRIARERLYNEHQDKISRAIEESKLLEDAKRQQEIALYIRQLEMERITQLRILIAKEIDRIHEEEAVMVCMAMLLT